MVRRCCHEKKIIYALNLMALAFIVSACGQTGSDTSLATQAEEKQTSDTTEISDSEAPAEYDNLQTMFLNITASTSEDDVKAAIEQYGLASTVEEYSGTPKERTYKAAYSDGAAKQKYADAGDSGEISFNQDDGSLTTAVYSCSKTLKSAVLYNYGTYWDFNFEKGNEYSGYYWIDPGNSKGGVTLEYSNGNKAETGYNRAADAEEAVKEAITEG